jgi:hypothetical protein
MNQSSKKTLYCYNFDSYEKYIQFDNFSLYKNNDNI